MPIVNYERIAQRHRAKILESEKISTTNKEVLERFLGRRRVSDARNAIVLERIVPLLERFPDLQAALVDRAAMSRLFKELEGQCAASTFATYVNVTRCFLRWLNDGEKPASMKDVSPPPRSATKRRLDPEQLLDWDDVLRMIAHTGSVQLKALVAVQFDGGFRPSEFHDLNVENVREVDGLLVVHVRRGKTGARQVILHRSGDYLRAWLDSHPGRSRESPLWISETQALKSPARIARYNYPAMRMRVKTLADRTGIKKAMDFYGLRHASCAADKRDNLPIDIGAARHGHTVKYFTEYYGKISIEGTVQRVRQHYRVGASAPAAQNPPSESQGGVGGVREQLLQVALEELRRTLGHQKIGPDSALPKPV